MEQSSWPIPIIDLLPSSTTLVCGVLPSVVPNGCSSPEPNQFHRIFLCLGVPAICAVTTGAQTCDRHGN